jgi:hypothetical protein
MGGRINWLGYERDMLKERIKEIQNRKYNGMELTQDEDDLIEMLHGLTVKCSIERVIENFFEVLDEMLYFVNKRGECSEDD